VTSFRMAAKPMSGNSKSANNWLSLVSGLIMAKHSSRSENRPVQLSGKAQSVSVRSHRSILGRRGQATVELAVVFPVALVMVYLAINIMLYLGACARFDPLAAEAVRTQACSPDASCYSQGSRVSAIQAELDKNFPDSDLYQIEVQVQEVGSGGTSSEGLAFNLLPHQERYVCTLTFKPWGIPNGLFGVMLIEVSHSQEYVIDPYRPGVVF